MIDPKEYYAAGRRDIVIKSVWARCWNCFETFPALRTEWLDANDKSIGSCPACYVDSVVSDAAGLDMSDEALKAMARTSWGI